jgi:glycosyltransferase involved in cell wall biosynthesis
MKILSLYLNRDGCSFYRVRQPISYINNINGCFAKVLEHSTKEDDLADYINQADVIILRPQHTDIFFYLSEAMPSILKKLIVLDLDDDLWNITPFAETYRWGGIEEVKWNKKWLWKDKQNNFDIERNFKNLSKLIAFVKECGLVTVSTPYLKNRIIEMTGKKEVEVLPNGIDFKHWKNWDFYKDNKTELRVGWTGGSTHYIDWFTIIKPLQKCFKKHKAKLVLQGCKWDGTIKGIKHEFHNWIDFEGHPYKTASLNLDFAIIPLKDTLFNASKSCIKWYEFSSLGVPCLVANVAPYNTEIEHGKTGLLYNNDEEFEKYFAQLATDKGLRDRLADNANKWVQKNRDIANIANLYTKTYKKYIKKRK